MSDYEVTLVNDNSKTLAKFYELQRQKLTPVQCMNSLRLN